MITLRKIKKIKIICNLSFDSNYLRKCCLDYDRIVVDKFVAENTIKGKLIRVEPTCCQRGLLLVASQHLQLLQTFLSETRFLAFSEHVSEKFEVK